MESDYSWSRIGSNLGSSLLTGGLAALTSYAWWNRNEGEDTWYGPIIKYNDDVPSYAALAIPVLTVGAGYIFYNGAWVPAKKRTIDWLKSRKFNVLPASFGSGMGLGATITYFSPICGLCFSGAVGIASLVYLTSESDEGTTQSQGPFAPPLRGADEDSLMINLVVNPLGDNSTINSVNPLHIDYGVTIEDPRTEFLKYKDLTAAFIGYMLTDAHALGKNMLSFLTSTNGEGLRKFYEGGIPLKILKRDYIGKESYLSHLSLMNQLLKAKFGIERKDADGESVKYGKEDRTPEQNEFREALLETGGELEKLRHPDVIIGGKTLIDRNMMTSLLAEMYKIVSEDNIKEKAAAAAEKKRTRNFDYF